MFGELPAKAELTPVPPMTPAASRRQVEVIEMDVPQSVARCSACRHRRARTPTSCRRFVLNHILGGGGFASRLMEEVREKRGLAYSVSQLPASPTSSAGLFAGGVATKNEEIAQSLDVIRAEFKRMADDGPTADRARQRQELPDRLLRRCASTPTRRSPTSCSASCSTTSASTTSTTAMRRSRR